MVFLVISPINNNASSGMEKLCELVIADEFYVAMVICDLRQSNIRSCGQSYSQCRFGNATACAVLDVIRNPRVNGITLESDAKYPILYQKIMLLIRAK